MSDQILPEAIPPTLHASKHYRVGGRAMKTNSFFAHSTQRTSRSSALLISLLMLSLITIIAVAFLGTMNWELSASRRNYDNQKAQALAMLGMNTAVAQLRHGLDTWDNPYSNFATNPPAFYWSMSPGLLTRWSYTSTTPQSTYRLFSVSATNLANSTPIGDGTYAVTTNLVNLNAVMGDGTFPIAGITNTTVVGATAPNISVYWVNVLKNPASATASSSNPLVGRYAFWIDDENAKINVNTADGTMKYTTNSLGLGSPSEVSLQALQQGGAALSTTVATNIVYLARTTGLNSPKEILRAAGTTPDLYTNNEFNLTAYSRSPDLNIFGQPKMALMPILGTSLSTSTDMATNGITFQPVREIYPTPSQLSTYGITNAVNWAAQPTQWYPTTAPAGTRVAWPLAFRGIMGSYNSGNYGAGLSEGGAQNTYVLTNYCWINGLMLAKYLAGTNAAGQSITWPAFPGSASPSRGFLSKYSSRQIDSIVAQMVSLGAKAISPDRTSIDDARNDIANGYQGRSTTTPPFFFGWLSHQWVNGMGRSPKVNAMELAFSTYGSVTNPSPGTNTPPYATLNIFQEWWMPANYLGGNNTMSISNGVINIGPGVNRAYLNAGDLTRNIGPYAGTNAGAVTNFPNYYWPPAPLPKLPDSVGSTTNYWGNQLLANNQGLDFQGIPSNRQDPDQVLADTYHVPYAVTNSSGFLMGVNAQAGAGTVIFSSPLGMYSLQAASPSTVTPKLQPAATNGDWAPGELRMIASNFGNITLLKMQMAAAGATLTIQGGIQTRAEIINLSFSDVDPTPLETIRGEISSGTTILTGPGTETELYDNEAWTNIATINSINSMPGSAAGATVRDRNIASVIPTPLSLPVPANHLASDPDEGNANTEYILATVDDPLVNKFPGDWSVTTSSTRPTIATYWGNIDSSGVPSRIFTTNSATEFSSGFHSTLNRGTSTPSVVPDPDSYWMPQQDVPICYLTNVPSQTLIPRSARFPNIGYLQYLRTGIIPDDESLSYSPTGLTRSQYQHGTPFRLLSYAPSTESASQETTKSGSAPYPDWAMLDLLYIPSMLNSYRSPYGYYEVTGTWQGYGAPSVLANYSTGGGSTPGRLNPNGAVIYTTNVSLPQPGVARTVPLQALLQGIMVNQTNNVSISPTAGYSGGSLVDASISESDAQSIPVAIEQYIRTNGPLQMPGQLCNVAAIASLRPSVNPTRNDLIRQVLGALTTQSDTFSVWVAGQSLAKSTGNTSGLLATDPNWGLYQAGDQILSSVRYHFVLERYVDPGADGVYGNSINPGVDGVIGTYDDPVDPANVYHPFQPRYLYRVIFSEEIR